MTLNPTTHARVSDPDTSHAAAAALSPKATMLRRLLVAYREYGPQTTDEVIVSAGFGPVDGAWKRVSDLLHLGLIEDTGDRRPGLSGRDQRVCQISEAGQEYLS